MRSPPLRGDADATALRSGDQALPLQETRRLDLVERRADMAKKGVGHGRHRRRGFGRSQGAPSAPVDKPLAAMDGVRFRRQPAVRLMQDEGGRDPERRPRALDAGDEQAMRRRAGAGMHRQQRQRPEPVLRRRQDRRERVRAMDQRKPAAGPQQRKTGPDPCRERRSARVARKHMRAGLAGIRRDPNRAGLEKRGVGDDKVGRLVREPGRIAGRSRRKCRPRATRTRSASPLRAAFSAAISANVEVDLDEIGEDCGARG